MLNVVVMKEYDTYGKYIIKRTFQTSIVYFLSSFETICPNLIYAFDAFWRTIDVHFSFE